MTDAIFTIPGDPATPALVSGFGAVFTDVDLPFSTSLQFFNVHDLLLDTFFVPAGSVPDASLSFLGVSFTEGPIISRVRITSGNTALGPNDNPPTVDVVAMDDFLYSEPQRLAQAVPEPSTLLLISIVAGAALARSRRRRRSE